MVILLYMLPGFEKAEECCKVQAELRGTQERDDWAVAFICGIDALS